MNKERRVVVTGLGAVTPVGNTVKETWEGLIAGKNGIAPITGFDTTNFKAKLGAEVMLCDQSVCEALGVEIISRPVSTVDSGHVRHNPGHLARELMELRAQRSMRVVDPTARHGTKNQVER